LPHSWLALSADGSRDCRASSLDGALGPFGQLNAHAAAKSVTLGQAVLAARPPASSAPRGGPMRRSLGPPRFFAWSRP
jgi:hypothetical protein